MPVLGLGTSPMTDTESAEAVRSALGLGYRLVDTAENYRNESGVGQGITAAGIAREELFVTTKFNREWHSVDGARTAWRNATEKLGLNYIDLLLIHWPNPEQDRYVDAWKGLIRLLEDGSVKAIGTSNFKPRHLQRIIDETGVVPDVNQVQLSPYTTRQSTRDFDAEHKIITESWSPIKAEGLLDDPVLTAIAETHRRTVAQIVLRWHVQLGLVAVPKSSNPDRQAQNLAIFDFELNPDEMAAITALERGEEHAADSDRSGH